ncbi:MAG: GAF domain-containing protein [Gemmatimonadota bacterium]
MLSAEEVIRALASRRAAGGDRDDLLREAVCLIEAAEERFHWVGVYLLEPSTRSGGQAEPARVGGEGGPPRPGPPTPPAGELVLHNYVGRPTDHVRIPVGVGVCGTAVAEGRDINVPDVRALDNYLACSLETRSELVVLIRDPESGEIHGQLDLDSDRPAAFTEHDVRELGRVAEWLARLFV